jgi:hypothetical protein
MTYTFWVCDRAAVDTEAAADRAAVGAEKFFFTTKNILQELLSYFSSKYAMKFAEVGR